MGSTDYDALMIGVEKRFSNNWSARAAYTLSYSRGNTSGGGVPGSGFQLLDDLNLDLNEGPTSFDQRHNFVVSGTARVPRTGGLNVSWVARALSGTPFLPAQVGPGYVQNHDPEVHIWSGPTRLAVDFGFAGPQFTTFTVVAPQVGARLFVYSPVVGNYGWIDVPGVGPSGPPT